MVRCICVSRSVVLQQDGAKGGFIPMSIMAQTLALEAARPVTRR
jgi:hypothetical protein